MKLIQRFTIFTLLLTCAFSQVMAQSNPGVQVRNAHVRGLPPGVANTAAYMTLINNSDEELELTGALSPVAASASLHNTVKRAGGVMAMVPVESVILPARGRLELKSGGLHLMLMGLKAPLRDGNTVKLTLQFKGGITLDVSLPVVSVLNE